MIDADEWNQYARDTEAEIARLRAELEIANAFYKVAMAERDYERTVVDGLRAELTKPSKPDCRTCLHYTGTGYCEVIFGKACEEGSRYIPQRRFESGPLRLYEKEGK